MSAIITEYERLISTIINLEGIKTGQMFGKTCIKLNGKAIIAQHKEWIVFKLKGIEKEKALAENGAQLWDPSGKGRPMKEWIALGLSSKESFSFFTQAALNSLS